MKKLLLIVLATFLAPSVHGAALTKAKFTQVVNQVKVVAAGTRSIRPAQLNAQFNTPDLIQTGPRSLAELTAPDNTITRVGSNTIFSYAKSGRNVNLQKGSLLFHSPKGKGGGVIRTKAAAASVLGTTIVVSATLDGGFKCVVLEGKAQLQLPNGNFRVVRAGQVSFIMPGGKNFGPTVNINLEQLVKSSNLIQKFEAPLPSLPKIAEAVAKQNQLIVEEVFIETDVSLAPGEGAPDEQQVVTVKTEDLATNVVPDPESPLIKLARALSRDAVISTPHLDPDHLFGDLSSSFPGTTQSSPNGFLARNVDITTSTIDLSSYAAGGSFDIVADSMMRILTDPSPLSILGATSTHTTAGTAVKILGRTGLTVRDGLQINASYITDLTIGSGTDLSMRNVSIASVHGGVALRANNNLRVDGGSFSTPSGATLQMTAVNGDLTVGNASISSTSIQLNANIASGVATLDNTTFAGTPRVEITGHTIDIRNVNFAEGSYVILSPHTPGPPHEVVPIPGGVNFLGGVTYGGNPASAEICARIHVTGFCPPAPIAP